MDWSKLLQDGISTSIDGYWEKENVKAQTRIDQIKPVETPPQTTQTAINGSLAQNNIMIGGMAVNKTLGIVSATLLIGALLYKAFN